MTKPNKELDCAYCKRVRGSGYYQYKVEEQETKQWLCTNCFHLLKERHDKELHEMQSQIISKEDRKA